MPVSSSSSVTLCSTIFTLVSEGTMTVRADWPFAPLGPHDDTSSDAETPQEHSWIKGTDIGAYGMESILERLVCGRNVHGANSANLP